MEASQKMQEYFKRIDDEVHRAYSIANETKKKGFDPDDRVMIPLAKNMAERVEGLIATVAPEIVGKGVVARIAELEQQYGLQDWRVAFKIAEEVACEKFCKFEDKKKAIETGIRMGFAYVTVGVVSSPLEGFAGVKFNKRNDDGKEYFALFYSGPVRSAGGTGAAVSVLIADYVRKKLGYAQYDPEETEVKRACIEVADYHERVTNLQYRPSNEEVAFMASHIPVQIDGDGTAEINVSNYKGLKRIESDRIRGGFCLVIAECLSAKAKKLWKQLSKWGKDFDMEQWNFLGEFLELQDKIKAKGAVAKTAEKKELILPDYTFIKDLVAGRPIIAYPLRNGGLRLRYGRSRATGLSSDAINPATMIILDSFIGIGTQLKTERPGKSTTISVCDAIDGPIVKLNSGSVKRIENFEEAKRYSKEVAEILYLGDVLVNYGDFLNRGHKLVPCGFNEEWWALCVEKQLKDIPVADFEKKIGLEPGKIKQMLEKPQYVKFSFKESLDISKALDIPLHPRWIYYWNTISKEQFNALFSSLKKATVETGKIVIASPDADTKRALELIGIEHTAVGNEYVVVEKDDADALMENIGHLAKEPLGDSVLQIVNNMSSVLIKDKCGTFIGARMGRPEKAKMRKLKSSPHALFPVGYEGGRLRSFQAAIEKGKVTAQFPIRYCKNCGKRTIYLSCDECGSESVKKYFCPKCNKEMDSDTCHAHGKGLPFKKESIDINFFYNNALRKAKLQQQPEIVKGIRGTSNLEHIPEHILKGILRAKHNINVNKEGTIRYDMTEMSCTHFKPKEVGASVEKLKEMGYTHDCYGKELVDGEQVLELKAQDIILPACDAALEEGADNVLFRVANFIDDTLKYLYETEPYYKLNSKEDLIGHLCVAMSPHTAAGIVCRIVGFSRTQGFLAHPLLHCIMRRDCDGDEAAVMMLLDHLLNFSRKFLPDKRGATQDAPLLITTKLIPAEVDDMVFDMDTAWKYPIELYEMAEQYKSPSDLKSIETFRQRLGKESQYEGIGFTHDTTDFNTGVLCSSYKSIPSMKEKVQKQMILAEKIRAVDADDTARLVIERHFIRDIKGNLRKFSTQQFRCASCNEKFRRPPLSGKCPKCNGKLLFTISEGSVVKYLEPVRDLIKRYKLPPYLEQSVEITRKRIESVFGKESEKQEGLNKWFS